MITTIEEAIKLCKNEVILCGVLSELYVDVRRTPPDDITLVYKGVVDVNKSYITFYGTVTNNSSMFTSIAKELNSFEAEVIVRAEDGEEVDTKYSKKASKVYVRGGVVSPNSIRADYVSASDMSPRFTSYIVGVYLGDGDVLIINPYYHNIIRTVCPDTPSEFVGCTVCMVPMLNAYDEHFPPIEMTNVKKCDEQISQDVITQAKLEHDIYIKSMSGGYDRE